VFTRQFRASERKMHDVDRRIATVFYDLPPTKIYYYGTSEGGREGLTMTQRFPKQDHGVGGLSLVAPCAVSLPRSCGMSFQSFDHTTVKRRRFGTRPTVVSGKFPALFEISAPVLRCPAVMSWPQQSENGELVTRERIQHGPRRATSPSPR
jgi:hypothetical protein